MTYEQIQKEIEEQYDLIRMFEREISETNNKDYIKELEEYIKYREIEIEDLEDYDEYD